MKKNEKIRAKEFSIKNCSRIRREDGLKMRCVKKYTFRDFIEAVSARYPDKLCYTICGGEDEVSFSYRYLAFKVHAISQYLLDHGIEKGDRVCLYGESSPLWMMFYFGLTSIGAIAVPILPGFSGPEAVTAMKDSECKAICTQYKGFSQVKEYVLENKLEIFRMEDLFHIPDEVRDQLTAENFLSIPGVDITHSRFNLKKLNALPLEEDDIASIIYTSGTTGSSKGVVLTHKNILWTADVCSDEFIHIKPGYRVLSLLPCSHIYEFTVGQLLSMMTGCEVHFLGKPPAVSVLLPALKQVRPHIVQTVPLLIEKVYKSAVQPLIREGGKLHSLYSNPITGRFTAGVIRNKLKTTFGGKLKFFGIGGAALDKEVESFLCKAGFPYALGYGLTETSPMIAGCPPKRRAHHIGYVGHIVPGVEVRILDPDSEGVGEIAVKGPNVTPGYYHNDALNAEVFTEDGFFRTGDLGLLDKRGLLAIKGRCKTMILGPAGENIYPESIESVINNLEFVEESLVVPENGALVALIKIDIELMAKKLQLNLTEAQEEAKKYVESLRPVVNKQLSKQNRIDSVELQEESFERTATQKIKRFLYPKKKK